MAKKGFVDVLANSLENTGMREQREMSGGFVRGSSGGSNSNAANSYGTEYEDLINLLRDNPDMPISQLLGALTVSSEGLRNGAVDDLNKSLLDTLLQYRLTQENRSYNEGLRNEQRLYDLPINQLARLMGAGIGRDAAIQMLGAGCSGGGASVPFSDPSALASAIPSSESRLNYEQAELAQLQGKLGIANTVFGALSAVGGLTSLGMSVAQAVPQISVMKNQAYLTQQQRDAYDAASGAFSVINAAGVENKDDVFGSIDKTVKTIEGLASSGNSAAKMFIDSGGVDQLRNTSPYSAPFLNQLYRNERDSADYNKSFSMQINQGFAQIDLSNANRDHLRKGIQVMEEQISDIREDVNYKKALTALTNAQEELTNTTNRKTEHEISLVDMQTALTGDQISLTAEQVDAAYMSNEVTRNFLDSSIDGKSGLELYTDSRLQELYSTVAKLSYLNDQDAWKAEADALLANYDNSVAVLELSTLYANGAFDAIENADEGMQSLLYFCRAGKECGLFEYVDTKIKAKTGRNIRLLYGSGFNSSVNSAVDPLARLQGSANKDARRRRGK